MMEDAQQSSEIVLDRLLLCSVPATVLFDSEASHSFMSDAFAKSLDLPRKRLPTPLAIDSTGSRMQSSGSIPGVEICIQGVTFSSPLIVLPCSDIDVILG